MLGIWLSPSMYDREVLKKWMHWIHYRIHLEIWVHVEMLVGQRQRVRGCQGGRARYREGICDDCCATRHSAQVRAHKRNHYRRFLSMSASSNDLKQWKVLCLSFNSSTYTRSSLYTSPLLYCIVGYNPKIASSMKE